MQDPRWLLWGRRLQAIAQTGLTFNHDSYDRERYAQIAELAVEMIAAQSGGSAAQLRELFARDSGYPTPKIDVRAAVFDTAQRLLFVREAADAGRWTLPGGWADVNLTPAENAVKEVREESGFDARIIKLAAAWDRARQDHPPSVWSCLKLFFLCELTGGTARTSHETSEVAWFSRAQIPADLSLGRVLPHQIARMYDHLADRALPTDYE